MNITNVFQLLQQATDVVAGNAFLSLLIGISIAALVFGLLSRIFVRR